jgi:hypothetical protein
MRFSESVWEKLPASESFRGEGGGEGGQTPPA